MNVVDEVLQLLQSSGGEQYFGEAVTKLQHAEQCASLARQAGAEDELVLAALLHDIGHVLDAPGAVRDPHVGVVNHDRIAEQWLLERGFSRRVAALVGGHVDAKRYLTATDGSYHQRLSPASRETLALQGGPMHQSQAAAYALRPDLRDLLRLRAWDEMAKDPNSSGPPLETYRDLLIRHLAL